jgi:hypothetical protein
LTGEATSRWCKREGDIRRPRAERWLDHPEYPGIRGTCTALRYGQEFIFVTAAHVVERNDNRTIIEVALGFGGEPLRCRIRDLLKPRPSHEEDEAVCDFAVMRPVFVPAFVEGESGARDIARFARMSAAMAVDVDAGNCIAGSSYQYREAHMEWAWSPMGLVLAWILLHSADYLLTVVNARTYQRGGCDHASTSAGGASS